MAGGYDTSCLYSTVKNTSGGRKTFGFLPPHGKSLASGEEMTVFGDIRQAIIRFERTEARRNIIAFEAALARQDIDIISTAAVIIEDIGNREVPKRIILSGGTLGIADACWNASLSSTPPIG